MIKRSLIVQASNNCPCFCPGCYNFFSEAEISTTEIIKFLIDYRNYFGVSKITISGGDPLLRKDIISMLDSLLNEKFDITVDTVGLSILQYDKALYDCLRRISVFGVPLDGICSDTIGCFRKWVPFEDAENVIRTACLINSNVCINTVLHKKNIHELCSMANVVNSFPNVTKWQLFQYMPIVTRGVSEAKYYSISDNTFDMCIQTIESFRFPRKIKIDFKSLSSRKNRYIMLATDGMLWYPKQSSGKKWMAEDSNSERIVIGSISEKNILKKLEGVVSE